MVFRITLTAIITLLLTSPVFSQAKVGATGVRFLEMSPDVRGIGMGHTGTAVTDSWSGFYNPAAVAMINNDRRFNLSLGYTDIPPDVDVTHLFLITKLKKPEDGDGKGFHLGTGFYTTFLNTGNLIETTYPHGTEEGIGRIFQANDRSFIFSLGAGQSAFLDFSVGYAFKYIKEKYADEETQGVAFDFGFQVSKDLGAYLFKSHNNDKYRWVFQPSLGVAFINLGPDLEMVQNDYPLPKKWSPGLALEIARDKISGTYLQRQFSIVATVEIDDYLLNDALESQYKAGIELGLFEAVYARAGNGGSEDVSFNWGFSLKSRGLAVLLGAGRSSPGSLGYFFREKIKITFNYARDDVDIFPDNNHYSLTVSF